MRLFWFPLCLMNFISIFSGKNLNSVFSSSPFVSSPNTTSYKTSSIVIIRLLKIITSLITLAHKYYPVRKCLILYELSHVNKPPYGTFITIKKTNQKKTLNISLFSSFQRLFFLSEALFLLDFTFDSCCKVSSWYSSLILEFRS